MPAQRINAKIVPAFLSETITPASVFFAFTHADDHKTTT